MVKYLKRLLQEKNYQMDKEVKDFLNAKCFSIADLNKIEDIFARLYQKTEELRTSRDKWRARYEELKLLKLFPYYYKLIDKREKILQEKN